mgnify:CR=1 FL=1
MAKLNLNLADVKEQSNSGYSMIPAGKYEMKVVKTEVKDTKSGGAMLVCDLEVQDFGDHVSKRIPYQMNIVNASAEAQRIGLSQLKSLAIACHVKNPNAIGDSDELITGVSFEAEVTTETVNDKTYSKVKWINALNKQTQTTTTQEQKLPWQK